MTRREISNGVGNISACYIQEAADYSTQEKQRTYWKGLTVKRLAAALFALCLLAGAVSTLLPRGGVALAAYAQGTDEEITAAGAVLHTGTISDTGEMTGHPLMFYLAGRDIASVRFSCKNQQLNFMDWTEKRDEYGNAQNFTVSYGGDADEYYYLTIDWVPNTSIRALTDDAETSIASLPAELREDLIVMEVTFEGGETVTKAIAVSLLDDGAVKASFQDYEITGADSFVFRPDSEAIPRDILYAQGG